MGPGLLTIAHMLQLDNLDSAMEERRKKEAPYQVSRAWGKMGLDTLDHGSRVVGNLLCIKSLSGAYSLDIVLPMAEVVSTGTEAEDKYTGIMWLNGGREYVLISLSPVSKFGVMSLLSRAPK